MKKAITAALGCFFALVMLPCAAWADELYVGGQAVGIEISAEGVIVSGFSEVQTADGAVSPAKDAGFELGDIIIKMEGRDIRCAEDLIAATAAIDGREACVTALRDGKTVELTVRPALADTDQWLLGMWLRDGVSGIGTVTFVDPESGTFGALGHSVSDENTGRTVPLKSGSLYAAQISGVTPGTPGQPGELSGSGDGSAPLGEVEKNTPEGIFGHICTEMHGTTAQTGDIRTGAATIVATLSGSEPREFSVEIDRVYSDGGQTHAMFTVTDDELVDSAGGIVQGMSGSPIIQDGCIVGAVTHVFINDPRKGFAIGIYDMLNAAELDEFAA